MSVHFDIVIVGGGLIGTSLALALSSHFKIAIIEKSPSLFLNSQKNKVMNIEKTLETNIIKPAEDSNAKALALSRHSVEILQSLGVWPKVSEFADAIQSVHVSSRGRLGVTEIEAKKLGFSELGFVVDADLLNAALNEALENAACHQEETQEKCHEKITIFRHSEITQLEPYQKNNNIENENVNRNEFLFWTLQVNTQNTTATLTTNLLIGCDGTDSLQRKQQGIEAVIHDYQQTAIIANLGLLRDKGHANIAYERFLNQGSIAMLPFGKSRVKCVWVTTNEEAKALLQLAESDFLKQVYNIFGSRLGKFIRCSQRISLPLKSLSSTCLYSQRFVLMGNAASTMHPVAAQGFNLGLRDVNTLQKMLKEIRLEFKNDPGQIEILKKFDEKRRLDHATTHQLSHSLTGSGSISGSILAKGILCFDFISFVRQPILKTLGVF